MDDFIIIECEGTVREQRSGLEQKGFLFVPVELGALEGAKKYRVHIKIVNSTETALRFSDVSATCGCAKLVADGNEIPAFGIGKVVMDLKVPNAIDGQRESSRVTVGATFSLPEEPNAGFKLIVAYDLTSAFSFASDRVDIEIPEREPVIVAKVPVFVTPPLTIDALEVRETENLRDFSVKLIKDDTESGPYVELTIPRHAVGKSGLVGELVLGRPGTDHVTGTMVSIRHQEFLSLRPESLRLTRDNHSKPFEASAMLRVTIPESTVAEDGREQEENVQEKPDRLGPMPEVELTIGGHPARVQVRRLGGGGIFRLTVHFDGPVEVGVDDTLEVRWRIVFDGRERVIKSHAFVPKVHQN